MERKVCLVTGATSGLGQAAAVQLVQQGHEVVFTARDPARAEATLARLKAAGGEGRVSYLLADFASLRQVQRLAQDFRGRHARLDVLVNNAGTISWKREVSHDGFERTFAVNYLAHHLLTRELVPLLEASRPARIVHVASDAHRVGRIDFDDLQLERGYSAFRAYAQSKLANVLLSLDLMRRLANEGVTSNALHPGFVASNLGADNGRVARLVVKALSPLAKSPEVLARPLVHLALSPEVAEVSGGYFDGARRAQPSARGQDPVAARRLWETGEVLLGRVLGAG